MVPPLPPLHKEDLDEVVETVKLALSDPSLRQLSQRAVQAKIWHQCPAVAAVLQTLRTAEEAIRSEILQQTSQLVYQFHEHAIDATLDRAGLVLPPVVVDAKNGSTTTTDATTNSFAWMCLDSKERLYIILKEYDWLRDFFRRYPIHFYENSFQFVHNIPVKELCVRVKVIGLGIGGSMAVSGLAKRGIPVHGYEKRPEAGPRSVTSRYQNASWRAYDTAQSLVNEEAYTMLVENRQRIHMALPTVDGTTNIVETDRVQVILGAAIQVALDSARSYGAMLHFDCESGTSGGGGGGGADPSEHSLLYQSLENDNDDNRDGDDVFDMVALFCGAHTAHAFPGAVTEMWSWPELDSDCSVWLRVQPSEKTEPYCTRGGEIGAEHWHYTIESARWDLRDIERVQWNLTAAYETSMLRLQAGRDTSDLTEEQLTRKYKDQRVQLDAVKNRVQEMRQEGDIVSSNGNGSDCQSRFDYIFTNAPKNSHNLSKRDAVADSVVLDGGYSVKVQIATNSLVTDGPLLQDLHTQLVVLGGDASVPPNPLAAYGATLACDAAASVVVLATAIGHLKSIVQQIKNVPEPNELCQDGVVFDKDIWLEQLGELRSSYLLYFEARSRAETYFQFVQTLICNLYSLPAIYEWNELLVTR